MTSRLNVRTFTSEAHLSRHYPVLMSLPVSFALDGSGEIDIALAQSDAGSIAVAQETRPKAIVVVDAANLTAAAATRLADGDLPAHPLMMLSSLSAQLARIKSPDGVSLIRSHFSSEQGLRFTLVEHLCFLESAFGPLADLRLLRRGEHSYLGQATGSNGAPILWTGRCDASNTRFDLDWVAMAARLEIVAELDGSGRPPMIRIASGEGVSEPMPVYENPLRVFWRDVAGGNSSAAARTAMARLGATIRIVEELGIDA